MKKFEKGDRVRHIEDNTDPAIGTVTLRMNSERVMVDWGNGIGHLDYPDNRLVLDAFRKGDRVENVNNKPGFIMTVVDDQYTSGAVLVEWPNRTRHTEQAQHLKHTHAAPVAAKAGDLIGHFGGPHIHFETTRKYRDDDPKNPTPDSNPRYADTIVADDGKPMHNPFKGAVTSQISFKPEKPIIPEEMWDKVMKTKTRAKTLREAGKLIDGDRANDYDTKDDATGNFNRIAKLWEPILGVDVTATQVALCLTQLKVARIIVNPTKQDSWIDAAGYIALGSEIAEQETTNE